MSEIKEREICDVSSQLRDTTRLSASRAKTRSKTRRHYVEPLSVLTLCALIDSKSKRWVHVWPALALPGASGLRLRVAGTSTPLWWKQTVTDWLERRACHGDGETALKARAASLLVQQMSHRSYLCKSSDTRKELPPRRKHLQERCGEAESGAFARMTGNRCHRAVSQAEGDVW